MIVHQTLKKMYKNPKKLFLIDGLGAIVSAFLLGIVLVHFESVFGIPRKTLYLLAFIPCVFAAFDFYYYFKKVENFAAGLKLIAFANLMYCCLSIGFGFYHYQKLTAFGWMYIILEVGIIVSLVYLELKTAVHLKS